MTADLTGRTALVTGAGNGLGKAIAQRLGEAGARLILVGRRIQTLRAAQADLDPAGTSSRAVACDVSDPPAVRHLAEQVSDERISILINNAGIAGPVRELVHLGADEWDEVFAANVRSVFLMCQAFLPAIAQVGGGDIINIASVSGKRPLTRRTPYTASKLAVIGLTRTLAFEAAPLGVNVNSLSPGPVRGERMTRNFARESAATGSTVEQAVDAFVSRAAMRRLVEEHEVAAAALAMLEMPALCGADIDLSAGMIAP